MFWPFKSKTSKNGKHTEPTPLVEQLQDPESEAVTKRAEETLAASADACQTSQILDDEAMARLKKARANTDTARRKQKQEHEKISEVVDETTPA